VLPQNMAKTAANMKWLEVKGKVNVKSLLKKPNNFIKPFNPFFKKWVIFLTALLIVHSLLRVWQCIFSWFQIQNQN